MHQSIKAWLSQIILQSVSRYYNQLSCQTMLESGSTQKSCLATAKNYFIDMGPKIVEHLDFFMCASKSYKR